MKKILSAALVAALLPLLAVSARAEITVSSAEGPLKKDFSDLPKAAQKAIKYRRTLFAPVGQRTLALEAPVGMCFLDASYYEDYILLEDVQRVLDDMDAGQVLGLFAPCLDVSGFGFGGGTMPVFGVVTWLNPQVGETTPLGLADYLDGQQKEFRDALDDGFGGAPKDNAGAPKDDAAAKPEEKKNAAVKKADAPAASTALKEGKTPIGAITGTSTGKPALDKALQEVASGDDAQGAALEERFPDEKPASPPPAPGLKDDTYAAVAALMADEKEDKTAQKSVNSSSLSIAYTTLLMPFPGDYHVDAKARRTEAGVTVGYSAAFVRDYMKYRTSGIAGTTVLKHAPIQVMMSWTQKETPYDEKKARALMDAFLAQQVALNR